MFLVAGLAALIIHAPLIAAVIFIGLSTVIAIAKGKTEARFAAMTLLAHLHTPLAQDQFLTSLDDPDLRIAVTARLADTKRIAEGLAAFEASAISPAQHRPVTLDDVLVPPPHTRGGRGEKTSVQLTGGAMPALRDFQAKQLGDAGEEWDCTQLAVTLADGRPGIAKDPAASASFENCTTLAAASPRDSIAAASSRKAANCLRVASVNDCSMFFGFANGPWASSSTRRASASTSSTSSTVARERCGSASSTEEARRVPTGLEELDRVLGGGVVPGNGGTQRILEQLPYAIAMEMLLTGDAIDAQTALRWGLVNRVVPGSELLSAARALADDVKWAAPLSVAAILDIERQTASMDLLEAMTFIKSMPSYRAAVDSEDAQEGNRSFEEKRPPVWRGR